LKLVYEYRRKKQEEKELNAEITTTILSEMGFVVKALENGIL
jgi:hypothetical protein